MSESVGAIRMIEEDLRRTRRIEREKSRRKARGMRELEERLDRLSVVTYALLGLLQSRSGVSDEDLFREMTRVDLAAGAPEGETAPASHCEACGRTVARRHSSCIYCGSDRLVAIPVGPPARS